MLVWMDRGGRREDRDPDPCVCFWNQPVKTNSSLSTESPRGYDPQASVLVFNTGFSPCQTKRIEESFVYVPFKQEEITMRCVFSDHIFSRYFVFVSWWLNAYKARRDSSKLARSLL